MSGFGKRLREARKQMGLTQKELAERLNVGPSAIANYEKGTSSPKEDVLLKIFDALDIEPNFLFQDSFNCQTELENIISSAIVSFPIIGEVAAGYDGSAIEEPSGETEQIPVTWLHGLPQSEFFVLRVRGNSMYPDYQDGDHVLVRRTTSVDSGKIAVMGYDADSATLKKVEYIYGENWMKLIPLNPKYKTKLIKGADLELCRVYGEAWSLIRHVK